MGIQQSVVVNQVVVEKDVFGRGTGRIPHRVKHRWPVIGDEPSQFRQDHTIVQQEQFLYVFIEIHAQPFSLTNVGKIRRGFYGELKFWLLFFSQSCFIIFVLP
jgi:hypothetical protein